MADNFQSSKVAGNELSSAAKFSNFVQAVEDAINSLDNSNISAGAAIAVAKLAAGSNGDILTTTAGVPTWAPASSSSIPSGVITQYGGSAAPTGWLLCDGTAVSRTTYASLFTALGTVYGVGDGSTTFNLPDLRGRVAVGKGTNAAVDTLGENDGVAEANRRPQHRHTAHAHTAPWQSNGNQPGGGAAAGGSGTTATSSADGGSGNVNDSLDAPAFIVLNYIVKT
jgi:microcystin-dependent protein